MLVLGRRVNEALLIGREIRVMVTKVSKSGVVRIGIEAPPGLRVLREELIEPNQNSEIELKPKGVHV